ncbi:MAG: ABC transporter permease [Pirellula sp.]|nr:ABC transporter permease [Pirellula sp.]
MNLRSIVWKEMWERPTAMLTSVTAILLGVAALVAIRHVTVFSEREVAHQLETLGANILILPKAATLQDYYSADLNGQTLPEERVSQVLMASLPGVEKLSPKLCVPTQYDGKDVILTGILPQTEFQAKAAWQSVSMFSIKKHVGCTKVHSDSAEDASPEALATSRTIRELGDHEVVVGADTAARSELKTGSSLVLFGEKFRVVAVLPSTGTVDDGRIFAHLHTVQRCTKAGEVVSAIEVLGCCEDAAGDLVPQLSALLPDSKVVTVSQVVQTQVGINRLMARSSVFVLGVLVIVGGTTVASSISANVRERRREIGTLMALGAAPGLISRLFLLKAFWLGIAGGVGGCLIGIAAAVFLGPYWAGVSVAPLPLLALVAVAAALAVTLLAAYWPARRAARLDPCTCFQEV